MPLKDISEPTPPKGKTKDKPKKDSTRDTTDNPWKILDDGSRVRAGRKLPYEKEIHQLLIELSGAVALTDSFSAKVIENKSEELAYGYARLAKDDPRIKAFFEKLMTGTSWSAALIPTIAVVVPIAFHYGLVPARIGVPASLMVGVVPMTRAQEQEAKEHVRQEQEQAAAQDRATHPHGEGPQGDGDNPS